MYDENLIDEILVRSSQILSNPKVKKIEDDFAGYFDELGIIIWLADETSDEEMNTFAADMLDYLNSVLPKDKGEFKWVLSFYRSLEKIGLFYPGDTVEDNCAPRRKNVG